MIPSRYHIHSSMRHEGVSWKVCSIKTNVLLVFFLQHSLFTSVFVDLIEPASLAFLGLPGEGRGVGLSERVPRDLRSSDAREARKDLFCLVKHEMSDEKLSQEPLLVWPAALHQRSKHFLGIANTTQTLLRPEFTDERRAEIRKLMIALRRDFPQLNRAAAWYQSLLERKPEENLEPYTHLTSPMKAFVHMTLSWVLPNPL